MEISAIATAVVSILGIVLYLLKQREVSALRSKNPALAQALSEVQKEREEMERALARGDSVAFAECLRRLDSRLDLLFRLQQKPPVPQPPASGGASDPGS